MFADIVLARGGETEDAEGQVDDGWRDWVVGLRPQDTHGRWATKPEEEACYLCGR